MKRISFLSPFSYPYFSILLLPKEKKEKEKKRTHFYIFSIQPSPIQFAAPISSSRSKKKKEEHRKTSPLPFPSLPFGRTYLTYLAPILFPPIPPLPRFDSHFPFPNPYKFPCLARLVDV